MLDKDLQEFIGKPKNKDTVLSAGAFFPVVGLAPVRAPAPETAPSVNESSLDDQNPPFIEEVLEAEEIPISELPRAIPKIEKIMPEFSNIDDAERNSRVAQLTEQFRQNQRTVSYQSGLRKRRLWMFLLLLLLLLGLLGAWGVFAWNKARNVVVQPPEPAPEPVIVSQDIAPPEPEPKPEPIEPVSEDVVSDEVVVVAPPEPPVEIVILPEPEPEPKPAPKPVPQRVSSPKPAAPPKPAPKKHPPAPQPVKKLPAPAKKPPAPAPPSENGVVIPGAPPRDPRIFRPPRGGLLLCPF